MNVSSKCPDQCTASVVSECLYDRERRMFVSVCVLATLQSTPHLVLFPHELCIYLQEC